MKVYNCLYFAQSLLYPRHCLLCDAPLPSAAHLCPQCLAEMPFNRQACPSCALPIRTGDALLCGHCTRHPPPFTHSRIPLLYQPPVSQLIGDLKFRHRLHLARGLSRLFCEAMPSDLALPDLIVPVPLHPSRLRERGFNQSQELARRVAAEFELPLDNGGCRRILATAPQSRLDRRARRRNLRSAFTAEARFAGLRVALFDDVVTTGSTVTAATQALLRAGAAQVEVWALARTPQP